MEAYWEILERFEGEGRLRQIPEHRDVSELYDLCSNDYMGLAKRAGEFRPVFAHRWPDVAMTASASRLLVSDQIIFTQLEHYLSAAYGKDALLFNSGYHANVGIVNALNIPGTLWLTDKLIHASVIDGVRMAHAEFKRWNHNDVAHLRKILERENGNYDRLIVVCESIYSMDGDIAPLRELCVLKEEYPKVMLYIDEAHAVGAHGPQGLGICAWLDILSEVDILVGTLGKACASVGAFTVTSRELKDYLINTARSLIFSTAIAPANAAWSLMMLEKLAGMEAERAHLAHISKVFRKGIEKITGEENPSRSAIVPLLTGNSERAVLISRNLEQAGVLALPIRRPTVPPGGERIRFSLHAGLSVNDIHVILTKIRTACEKVGPAKN